jgi:hypothetical protein
MLGSPPRSSRLHSGLSALLLQVFYGIRSERQLMEQLDYNLLYRWFVGLSDRSSTQSPLPRVSPMTTRSLVGIQ